MTAASRPGNFPEGFTGGGAGAVRARTRQADVVDEDSLRDPRDPEV